MGDSDKDLPLASASEKVAATGQPRITTFISLRNRNYRWFWFSLLGTFTGQMMQNLAGGWLVYDMTGSPLALGMVSAAWGVPMILLSIYGGVVADRVNKRKLLIVTQLTTMVITALVAVLIVTGAIAVWHIAVAAALTGITFAFDAPGRQALIPALVPGRDLMNAIALNSIGNNLMRVGAPALAGFLVAIIGVGGVYLVSVALYAGAAVALFMISVDGRVERAMKTTVPRDALEGLKYIFREPVILSLLVLAFVSIFVAMPYMQLMPAFVVDVLRGGPTTLGWLSAVGGTGALVGSLFIASLGGFKKKGLLMLGIAFAFGIVLILFSLSRSLAVALVLIFGVGLANAAYLVLNNTLLQTNVSNWVRGRVMSIYAMTFALPLVGTLIVGAIAEYSGIPVVIAGSGAVVALFVLAIAIFYRRLRRLE